MSLRKQFNIELLDNKSVEMDQLFTQILEGKHHYIYEIKWLFSPERRKVIFRKNSQEVQDYYDATADVLYWRAHTDTATTAAHVKKFTDDLKTNPREALEEFSIFLLHLKRIKPKLHDELLEVLDFGTTFKIQGKGQLSDLLTNGYCSLGSDNIATLAEALQDRMDNRFKQQQDRLFPSSPDLGDLFDFQMSDMLALAEERLDVARSDFRVLCSNEPPAIDKLWAEKNVYKLRDWFQDDRTRAGDDTLNWIVYGGTERAQPFSTEQLCLAFRNNPKADRNLAALWIPFFKEHPYKEEKLALVEVLHGKRFLNFLKTLNSKNQQTELGCSLAILDSVISEHGGPNANPQAAHLYQLIQKTSASSKNTPLLTELAYRTAIAIRFSQQNKKKLSEQDQKNLQRNLLRYTTVVQEVAKHSWGQKIACGAVLFLAAISGASFFGLPLAYLFYETAQNMWKKPANYEIREMSQHFLYHSKSKMAEKTLASKMQPDENEEFMSLKLNN